MPYSVGERGAYGCSGYATVDNKGKVYGCHETKEQAVEQLQALSAATGKYVSKGHDELYAALTPIEKAYHDALVGVVNEFGPFDQGSQSVWVGYEPANENEDAEIGVKCSNCAFFMPENNGCHILSYQVEPGGKCRLAAIPDGLVNVDSEQEDEMEMMNKSIWGGRFNPRG